VAWNARFYWHAFLFSTAMSVLTLTTSFYMLEVYDRVLTSRSLETLFLLSMISFIAIAVNSALDSLRTRLLLRSSMSFGARVGPQILRSMLATASRSGGLEARQGLRDMDTVRNFFGSPTIAQLFDTPFMLFYLLILLYLHWSYFALVLVGGGILAGIATADQLLTSRAVGRSIDTSNKAHAFAEDGVKNADVLEGMGMSQTFVDKWFKTWTGSLVSQLQSSDKDTLLAGMSKGIRSLIQIALLGIGALLVLEYHASGGIMIAASILGSRALAPIEAIVHAWKNVVTMRLSWVRLQNLLQNAPAREEGMRLPAPVGRIDVEAVGYSFPGTTRVMLSGINFTAMPGESIGIIGPSGSGKSTLVRLLVGAWPCFSGNVRLDGADIYSWPRSDLSRYIGYLPQDVELFGDTVRENITRLSEGDPNDVVKAAKLAGAHDMILGLPKGYDTIIGDEGQRLSGGQRQRVGLARALYGDVRYLVLDEPNSNLDTAGEQALQSCMAELKKMGVTIIIVSHRPMTLGSVDKILVLRDGFMEMFGPRAEVLQRLAGRGGAGAGGRPQGAGPSRPQQGGGQAKVVPLQPPAATHAAADESELKGAES
jgi:ATP-binding cassette subfamily C protein/ATP-binding cassette subfamily C protein EexD